ncbi:MAG: chromosomal protein MC1 [Myxococcales bacterium]|nr:chromosomal protein MC1 [Myxococcales bacterium]
MADDKATKEKKNFVLMENGKDTNIVFSNAQPRGAALKAAARGYTDIRLRERGTKRVHVFKGGRKEVTAPANRPKWLPEKVWKATVEKQGVEHLK